MGRGVRGAHVALGPPPPPPTIALPETPPRLGFCLPRFGLPGPCPQRAMAFGCRGENLSIRYRLCSLRFWRVIGPWRCHTGFSRLSLASPLLLFIRLYHGASRIVFPCWLVWACPRAWSGTTQQPAPCGRGVGLLRAALRFGQPSARRCIKTGSRNQSAAAPPASRLTAPPHPSRNPLQGNLRVCIRPGRKAGRGFDSGAAGSPSGLRRLASFQRQHTRQPSAVVLYRQRPRRHRSWRTSGGALSPPFG